MSKITIQQIRQLPGAASASEWKDRIYINVRGNGGNFAGERNSKIWIDKDGGLHIDFGKGTTSREWIESLKSFEAAYNAATGA